MRQQKCIQLQNYYNLVTILQDEVLEDIEEEQEEAVLSQFESCESKFQEAMAKITDMAEVLDAAEGQSRHSTTKMQKLPLPPITLNKFDGSFKNWTSFSSLYDTLVHTNDSLTDIQKLQYLKSSLIGDAAKIIQHLDLTEGNYEMAWETVKCRYNNKRLLAAVYLDQILDLPQIQSDSSDALRNMYDTITESLHSLKGIGIDIENWDVFLLHILVPKLDKESRKQYEERISNPKELQNMGDFRIFLEGRFQSLDAIKVKNSNKIYNKKSHHGTASATANVIVCGKCKGNHSLASCKQFLKFDIEERWKLVKQLNLCRNCMQSKHLTRFCKKSPCDSCGRKHNNLLHNEQLMKKSESKEIETQLNHPNSVQKNETKMSLTSESGSTQVLLATALVKVMNKYGTPSTLRALLDSGSQTSLITEDAAQRIGLRRQDSNLMITGLGKNAIRPKTSIALNIQPHFESSFSLHVKVHVLPKITGILPEKKINDNLDYWNNIHLADPMYNIPGSIDILLGADVYCSILGNKIKHGKPAAIETKLGWVISGPIASTEKINVVTVASLTELNQSLRNFWEIEEVRENNDPFICDADEHYRSTFTRQSNGRYTVRLPFKSTICLGTSRNRALARFFQTERYLNTKPIIRDQYHTFIREYLKLNHMQACFYNSSMEDGYYMPHHAVFKLEGGKSKIRVVFDASAKTSNGNSLNDLLIVGPTIQEKLCSILLRWRTHRFVITADIEKMYRQILIHKDDSKYQKILWRFSSNEPIKEYTLNTVTYGTSAAPYLAIRTLFQLAEDEENQFPEATEIIRRDFYVDDMLTGFDSIQQAKIMAEQLNTILKRGGFELKKWASNSKIIIERIPKENHMERVIDLIKDVEIKTLGVVWNPRLDEFTFRSVIDEKSKWTKREVLSNISKIYDPSGWLAPLTIKAKLLMQDIWKSSLNWDDELSQELHKRWSSIIQDLKGIEDIKIPRYLNTDAHTNVELHGFCDASEGAYAAVIYARVRCESKYISTVLAAKTKVTPIKKRQTIPRLELCGAVLLSNLMQEILRSVNNIKISNIYYWCDSTITLAWIKGPASKWKAFVAHRVSQIQSKTLSKNWHHVNSKENPADLSSRGVNVKQLIESKLWWCGPSWLADFSWRPSELAEREPQTDEEVRTPTVNTLTLQHNTMHVSDPCYSNVNELLTKYSSFKKLTRVVSYLRRFITKDTDHLKIHEIEEARLTILRQMQINEFDAEIQQLKGKSTVSTKSKIASLNPFIDEKGILRVGGRLANANISYNAKHPIILPSKHHITNIIIEDAHKRLLHSGTQATQAYLAEEYWIINARDRIRQILRQCIICHRFRKISSQELMADLPEERVTPSPPFSKSGVDYAGPIAIRMSKGRGCKSYKGYICLFICMTTKAIHLEVVSDLTSEAFIAAYKRFTSRRGHCSHIYSDNGSTFVGSNKLLCKELKDAIKLATKEVAALVANDGTKWHFIPPYTPHMGGLWEAGVKATKYHLRRVVGESALTFEELSTVLAQIEACLNSRPLYPVSSDPSDFSALTPGHFIIGRPIVGIPETDKGEVLVTNRWKLLSKITQDFWKRWSSEYLTQLQQRQKWNKEHNTVKLGDLVLIKEDNTPPTKWHIGRVTDLYPGADNKTRVVAVKTSNGSITKRHLNKLSPLPIESPDEVRSGDNSSTIRSNSTCDSHINITSKKLCLFITTMLCIFIGSSEASSLPIYPIHNSGLIFAHHRTAWIRQGTWHVFINTTRNITEDLNILTDGFNKLNNICENVEGRSLSIKCDNIITGLHLTTENIKAKIGNILRPRPKRSRGIMSFLGDLIFGNSDREEIELIKDNQNQFIRKTSGVLSATLKSVEEMQTSTNQRLHIYENKLNELVSFTNDQRRLSEKTFMEVQFLHALESAKSIIENIWVYYQQYEDFSIITQDELHSLTTQIQNRLPFGSRIHQAFSQWQTLHICKHKMQVINDILILILDVPIVNMHSYEIFKVVSIPDINTRLIIETQHDYVGVNHETLSFFYPEISSYEMQINDDEWIYNNIVLSHDISSFDCVTASIFRKNNLVKKLCKFNSLPDEFDEWITLPDINNYVYYTTRLDEVAIICNESRIEPTHAVAMVKLKPGCQVTTWKKKIFATTDVSNRMATTFFHPHAIEYLRNQTVPNIEYLINNSTIKNVSTLEDEVETLKDLYTYRSNVDNKYTVHLVWGGVTSSLILIILVLIIILYIKRKALHGNETRNQRQFISQELSIREQETEEPLTSTSTSKSAQQAIHRRKAGSFRWPTLSLRRKNLRATTSEVMV